MYKIVMQEMDSFVNSVLDIAILIFSLDNYYISTSGLHLEIYQGGGAKV